MNKNSEIRYRVICSAYPSHFHEYHTWERAKKEQVEAIQKEENMSSLAGRIDRQGCYPWKIQSTESTPWEDTDV